MQYHYKSSNGQRLPNPPPGCPLSLQLEPSNPYHHNAIKVINDIDTRHLGYIVRETADVLTMLLKGNNNTFASARTFLSAPGTHNRNLDQDVISCQVLLFFAVPLHLVPPLPPQLRFHEDLSSPDFVLAGTPVALTGYTLHAFDEYKAQCMASLHLQTLLRPCSTNTNSPVHVRDSDATAPLEPPPQSQVQVPTDEVVIIDHSKRFDGTVESDNSVSGPPTNAETQLLDAEMNEVVCMKCKETGRGLFFQCDQNGCPVLIHESCIGGVVGHTCLFCLFLACRGERLRVKKGSDLYVALKSKYEQARKSAIRFFGKKTFMRLRELAGLDPLLPTQVQVPCNANMKCNTKEGREKEAVGTSTIIEKSASKEKKEKEAVGTRTIIEKSASKEKKEKEAVGMSTIIEKSASKEKKEKEAVGTSTIIEKSASKEKKEKEAVGTSTIIEKSASKDKKEKEAVGTSTIIEKSASKEKKEKEAVGTSTIIEKSASKEKKEKEAVGTSTIIEKSASKEKKEKVVGHGKRRLPPRLSLNRACKKRIQASSLPW
ncbi:Dynein heavy chain-like protein [Carex littledalei]|uniref:Dynein heavy chain-like protein n=1 Tax=Carex littledalei TaxID=544730 RepID=A0A833VGT2_9POAL|nr:Dynein heavy chain-like protein [Carex littledalei]